MNLHILKTRPEGQILEQDGSKFILNNLDSSCQAIQCSSFASGAALLVFLTGLN